MRTFLIPALSVVPIDEIVHLQLTLQIRNNHRGVWSNAGVVAYAVVAPIHHNDVPIPMTQIPWNL